jgi:hypothetical protein
VAAKPARRRPGAAESAAVTQRLWTGVLNGCNGDMESCRPSALAGNSMCPPQNAHKHFKNFAWTGSTCSFRRGGVGGAGLCGTTGAGAGLAGRTTGCDTGGVPDGMDRGGIGIWRGASAGAALRATSGCEASGSLTTIRGGSGAAGVVAATAASCLVSRSFRSPGQFRHFLLQFSMPLFEPLQVPTFLIVHKWFRSLHRCC